MLVPVAGVHDIFLLASLFNGTLTSDMLTQLSYEQLYFYAIFFLTSFRRKEYVSFSESVALAKWEDIEYFPAYCQWHASSWRTFVFLDEGHRVRC